MIPGRSSWCFPKPGYPDEWYRANEPRVLDWMDDEGVSHLFMINYMDTNRMIASRLARMPGASEAELEGAREQLREEHVERLRRLQRLVLRARRAGAAPHPLPLRRHRHLLRRDGDDGGVGRRGWPRARAGSSCTPASATTFPATSGCFPLYERLQEADVPVLSDTGSLSPAPEGGVLR